MRGYAWLALAGVKNYKKPGKYLELSAMTIDKSDQTVRDIIKDLPRTNPYNTFYKDLYGVGQTRLFHVLHNFSSFYKETSYVQGLGFLVANFLFYLDEESAFWLLYTLMENKKYNLKALYKPGFPALEKSYYKLLALMKFHCEKIYNQFKKFNISPHNYAMHWFVTIFFANNQIPDIVLRIFDIYLLDGEKTIFKMCLAFLKGSEERILAAKEMEEVLYLMKIVEESISIDKLMSISSSLQIKKSTLDELETKYLEIKSQNKSDEFIELINKCL